MSNILLPKPSLHNLHYQLQTAATSQLFNMFRPFGCHQAYTHMWLNQVIVCGSTYGIQVSHKSTLQETVIVIH